MSSLVFCTDTTRQSYFWSSLMNKRVECSSCEGPRHPVFCTSVTPKLSGEHASHGSSLSTIIPSSCTLLIRPLLCKAWREAFSLNVFHFIDSEYQTLLNQDLTRDLNSALFDLRWLNRPEHMLCFHSLKNLPATFPVVWSWRTTSQSEQS